MGGNCSAQLADLSLSVLEYKNLKLPPSMRLHRYIDIFSSLTIHLVLLTSLMFTKLTKY